MAGQLPLEYLNAAMDSQIQIALSPSVEGAAQRLSSEVSVWDFVRTILAVHGEYGKRSGRAA